MDQNEEFLKFLLACFIACVINFVVIYVLFIFFISNTDGTSKIFMIIISYSFIFMIDSFTFHYLLVKIKEDYR